MLLDDILSRWQGQLDHLPNFGFQLAAILYFLKGFTYDFGSKSEICHVFVYGYCGPGSFRVVRGSSKPFTKILNWASSGGLQASGFFSSSNRKAVQYSLNSNGTGMEQVVHTHRTSCRSGFERLAERVSVFCAYSSISVSSIPLFYLFTSATVRIAVHTTPKCDTKPIRYVTLFTKIQDHADQKSG